MLRKISSAVAVGWPLACSSRMKARWRAQRASASSTCCADKATGTTFDVNIDSSVDEPGSWQCRSRFRLRGLSSSSQNPHVLMRTRSEIPNYGQDQAEKDRSAKHQNPFPNLSGHRFFGLMSLKGRMLFSLDGVHTRGRRRCRRGPHASVRWAGSL
ncbi:hypothetical protein CHELA20_11481 [Hyphomicrobiales bacterium]|nr:hypothetical protein CHELA20_11481 [Hyphomicrobiales bacterium]CAH1695901.1 hypothetical protein CHELA41_51727 [Hyphomicrobiales bacterium]